MLKSGSHSHVPTIVYVEDNAGDAQLLAEALREGEHKVQVQVFESGEKALHYFNIKATAHDVPPPHCILLDAHLPVITGAQLLRYIRGSKNYDHTPVYIFAEERGYADILESHVVSKESFLTKPDSWDGFIELASLLMRSAVATLKAAELPATSDIPEVAAEGALRRHETKEQRERIIQGPSKVDDKT